MTESSKREPRRHEAAGVLRRKRQAGAARPLRMAAIAIVLVVGVVAGVLLHEPILHLFGGHDSGDRPAAGSSTQAQAKKQLWTCGMHPQVIRDEPGVCPICHMDLTPLEVGDNAAASANAAVVVIDPVVVQNMGVRVAEVVRGKVRRVVRAVGTLEEAQPLIHDVNLRVSGWVEQLHAATVGMHLERGEPLFDLYSPEVQVAVGELIAARKAGGRGGVDDALARDTSHALFEASRRKLEQLGLAAGQIAALERMERAPRTVTFLSPVTGHLTEKLIVEGSAVKAGDMAMRIVDHSTLWLDAQVYAQDQPLVMLGQKVTATVESVPGEQFEGTVAFIYPHIDVMTRTATMRLALPNPDLRLRPGMFAVARIETQSPHEALLVPREAVIDTGTRRIAFVAAEEGRFEPRDVETGASGDDGTIEILEGLAQGELVVTSGQFLLDAESRMREAVAKHLRDRLLVGGDAPSDAPGATSGGVRGAPAGGPSGAAPGAHVH